jgi:hypothetical protein
MFWREGGVMEGWIQHTDDGRVSELAHYEGFRREKTKKIWS